MVTSELRTAVIRTMATSDWPASAFQVWSWLDHETMAIEYDCEDVEEALDELVEQDKVAYQDDRMENGEDVRKFWLHSRRF